MERKVNPRTAQASGRKSSDTTPIEGNLNSTYVPWFESNIAGGDFVDIAGDESGILTSFGFNSWVEALGPLSPPLTASSLTALVTTDVDNCEDNEDVDENKSDDVAHDLSSQLVALSQRAMCSMRRLVRPGRPPLTVSSPEIHGVLEDTNILIRIINNITAPEWDRGDITVDTATSNSALPLLALTCHQHLVALFRAICETIYRWQKEQKEQEEHYQQQHQSQQYSDTRPSSVAQFVMVLQLLMHLINRIDRSVLQNQQSMLHGSPLSSGGYNTPVTSSDPMQSQTAAGGFSPPSGLLVIVKDIVGTIPNEHEKLRQAIQKLQTDMEFWLGED